RADIGAYIQGYGTGRQKSAEYVHLGFKVLAIGPNRLAYDYVIGVIEDKAVPALDEPLMSGFKQSWRRDHATSSHTAATTGKTVRRLVVLASRCTEARSSSAETRCLQDRARRSSRSHAA